MNEPGAAISEPFAGWLRRRIVDGPLPTEEIVRALVPLLKQVQAVHDNGMVGPLAGLAALHVSDGEIYFFGMEALAPQRHDSSLKAVEGAVSAALEVVSQTTVDSTDSTFNITSREIGIPGGKPTIPCFMPGYLAWEHAFDHHDALTDVFSLGLLLASMALGLDLAEDEDLRRLVSVRRNPFVHHPQLHPVVARCMVRMIEVRRGQRHQDLAAISRLLAGHRDQEQACRPLDHPLGEAGDAPRSRRGRIQARLRDRLFDCSRRNRLLYYRTSLAHLNLTIASVPLQLDLAAIRSEDLCTWGGTFTSAVLAGGAVNLGKWLRLEEAPYVAPTLDRIRLDERRDRTEYGASQLRLVVAFLRWHDLKEAPNERITSPLVLLPVGIERKRGVRDIWTLTATGTEAEINPALRHVLRLRYGLELPELIDLAKTSLQEFHQHLQSLIQASEPGVTLRLVERPRIDLIQERARARVDHHRRRGRLTGKGIRRQADIDYSYDATNFQPLGLQLFLRKVKPVPLPHAVVAGGGALQRTPWMVAVTEPLTDVGVRTRETFRVRDDGEANPYAWEIDLCSLTLGNFNYRKMTLVRDYRTLLERDVSHPAFDAVFSDAARPVDVPLSAVDPTGLWPVVASDPTQDTAVARARSGMSYVIQGPPGTGKSQTITNLIADHVARGKRVLFVCAKRAALDVVHHRLAQRGLDRLCCLIHDSQEDKKAFIQSLRIQYEDWLTRPDDLPALRHEREGIIAEVRSAVDPLTRYAACMADITDDDGLSLRLLLGRLVALGAQLPTAQQLTIELPGYATFQRHAAALHALARTLVDQRRPPYLQATGLRHVHPERFNDNHPAASISQACAFLGSDLAAMEQLIGVAGLVETISAVPVGAGAELVPEAKRLLVLAERELLKLIDRADPANEQLRAAVRARRTLAEAAKAATAKTAHWSDPIPAGDCAAVLAQTRAVEHGMIRFLHPTWWRLRKILQARYRFSAHVVAPLWSVIVTDLAAAYAAQEALAAYDRELLATWKVDDLNLLVTTLEEVHRPGSLGPAVTALRDAARRGLVTASAMVTIIAGESALVTLATHAASLLALGSALSLAAARSAVAEITADLPLVTHLLQPLRELSAAPAAMWNLLRNQSWTPEGMEAAVLADALRRAERREPGLAKFDLAMLGSATKRLGEAHRSLMEINARLILAETHARFVEKAKRSALPGAPDAKEREWRKHYARGRREMEHEFGKVMRLRSIRDLADGETGLVVADLKPVWLMSPLSVSDTLPLEQSGFDVVIFDEASQIPIEEAVPALYRAPLSVVVGDRQQLPPSDFFGGGGHDAEPTETPDTEDDEALPNELAHDSFLTQAATNLSGVMLGWHYRSRSEALIAFSNAAFYDGRLLTIPDRALPHPGSLIAPTAPEQAVDHLDAVLDRPISFHHLAPAPYEQRRNPAEAGYIAYLVRGLLSRGTAHSIGVVAFSEAQQSEIESAIRTVCTEDAVFREVYEAACQREDDGQHVGLFVKNLENVQGDERDIIILSVCYGHDRTGRMLMNFGPINRSGGEKRLNVVFSRAKHHLVVVSSITADSITNDYNLGALTLKRYLAYAQAASLGRVSESARILASCAAERIDRSKQEHDPVTERLAEALTGRGWVVDRDVGASHFRCDLAIRRTNDLTHRLGVLIDHDHDLRTLSTWERDVARPQTLMAFGWQVISIPALAWWREPTQVLEAISALMEPATEQPD